MSRLTIDQMLENARERLHRVYVYDVAAALERGAILVDIRPAAQRVREGSLPGALVIERNVLEWRLDPTSSARLSLAVDQVLVDAVLEHAAGLLGVGGEAAHEVVEGALHVEQHRVEARARRAERHTARLTVERGEAERVLEALRRVDGDDGGAPTASRQIGRAHV